MLQRSVHILATLMALVALLEGLMREWQFWAVARRSVAAYLAGYLVFGTLLLLGRMALSRDAEASSTAARKPEAGSGTDGTNAAV